MTVQLLMQLILYLVIVAVLIGLVQYFVRTLPIADPLGRIINIAAVAIGALIVVVLLLQIAGGIPLGIPVTR